MEKPELHFELTAYDKQRFNSADQHDHLGRPASTFTGRGGDAGHGAGNQGYKAINSAEMITEYQNWIHIAALAGLLFMGIGRALALKKKNVSVFVYDSQMTKIQFLNGIVFLTSFMAWIYESFAYGLSLDIHIPISTLHLSLVRHIGFKYLAVFIMVLGLLIYRSALLSFKESWRIGIDRERPGNLVTTGIFAWSRNPIYLSLDLLVFGTFLLQGNLVFLLLSILVAISLHIQILQEEKFLMRTYGGTYLAYCSKVNRYFNQIQSLL